MNKRRLCCFYVSDIHLITMLLPYINERINESTEIVTILEKDISESAKKVIANIQGKKSKELLNIKWKNTKLNNLKKLNLTNKLILISGSNEFLNKANSIINNKEENCTILNCYEMMQANENLNQILDAHDMVVNTSGEKKPEEVFTGYTQKSYKKITV